MATNVNWWRTSGSNEGGQVSFVDCDCGNDITGAGTRAKPYKTLSHAFAGGNSLSTKGQLIIPSTIVFRGTSHDTVLGNHAVLIKGDYWGAATFDGQGTNNLICTCLQYVKVLNGGVNVDVDYNVTPYASDLRAAFAGCGRAGAAGYASTADLVYGAYASPVLFDNCRLFRGQIGGERSVRFNIFSKIKANSTSCGVTLGTYSGNASTRNDQLSIYDCTFEQRSLSKSANTTSFHGYRCIFGKFDFILEQADYFYRCLFASDCRWFYVDKSTGNPESNKRLMIKWVKDTSLENPTFAFTVEDIITNYAGQSSDGVMTVTGNFNNIFDVLKALYAAGRTTVNPETYYLQDCVFSSQTSAQIWNNPDNLDFSLRQDSDGIIDTINYFGALGPALNVPIKGTGDSGSDQTPACWDNRTASGCIKVENDKICLDTTEASDTGAILSKVITCNPLILQFNGIYSHFTRSLLRGWIANNVNPFDEENKIVTSGSILVPDTRYLVKNGPVSFDSNVFQANHTISTFGYTQEQLDELPVIWTDEGVYLLPFIDTNIPDVLFCRCRSMVYARAQVGDTLLKNVTYLNDTQHYVKFHSRVIVPGESFVCKDDNETYAVCDASGNVDPSVTDAKIAVMFDDRETIPAGEERIGGVTKWVPAQLWGDYFAIKSEGAIQDITIPGIGDVPAASGNYQGFTNGGNGASISGNRSIINQTYLQLAIFVTKVSPFEVEEE